MHSTQMLRAHSARRGLRGFVLASMIMVAACSAPVVSQSSPSDVRPPSPTSTVTAGVPATIVPVETPDPTDTASPATKENDEWPKIVALLPEPRPGGTATLRFTHAALVSAATWDENGPGTLTLREDEITPTLTGDPQGPIYTNPSAKEVSKQYRDPLILVDPYNNFRSLLPADMAGYVKAHPDPAPFLFYDVGGQPIIVEMMLP